MGADHKLPTIEIAAALPDDGNPVYSMRSLNIRTIDDMELLLASVFNGLNLHMQNYCQQEGISLIETQFRVQHMIIGLAKGNATSPMTFEATSHADPAADQTESEAQDGEETEGPPPRDVRRGDEPGDEPMDW